MTHNPHTDNYAEAFGITKERGTEIKESIKNLLLDTTFIESGKVPTALAVTLVIGEQFRTNEERAFAIYASIKWVQIESNRKGIKEGIRIITNALRTKRV